MALTLEEYQGMNPSDRKRVKRGDLQTLLDEFLGEDADNIASLRGIIRDELTMKFDEQNKTLEEKYKKEFKDLKESNAKLQEEHNVLKKVVAEQQNFLETLRNDRTKNNLFISGTRFFFIRNRFIRNWTSARQKIKKLQGWSRGDLRNFQIKKIKK